MALMPPPHATTATRDAPPDPDLVPERITHSDRVAPLIDGIEYFRAVRDALIGAHRQVLIVGWELHSEIDLVRGDDREAVDDGYPVRFADLLIRLVREREHLEVNLLIWAGASLFALERQHLPRMKRPWDAHPRIRLVWDEDTPLMGSQHQKFVVIDDRVAMTGGMDLTKCRWDTHEHAAGDRRRRAPGLLPNHGHPYHDAMIALDSDAARTLGDWGRERWRRVTGERLPRPDTGVPGEDPWPAQLEPMLRDREIGFALTQPEAGGCEERREVEALFLEQIRSARRSIFIETQYLASDRITDALADRLRAPDGPGLVLIMPWGCPGAIQAMAMDPKRDELIGRLRSADEHGRLGIYWATLNAGSDDEVYENSVYIHAKVMIIDDELLRIGSANLNNRSMGLDSELDTSVRVPRDDREGIDAIAHLRRRLTSYLLHTDPETLARTERREGSIVGAIEALRGGNTHARAVQPLGPRFGAGDGAQHRARRPRQTDRTRRGGPNPRSDRGPDRSEGPHDPDQRGRDRVRAAPHRADPGRDRGARGRGRCLVVRERRRDRPGAGAV